MTVIRLGWVYFEALIFDLQLRQRLKPWHQIAYPSNDSRTFPTSMHRRLQNLTQNVSRLSKPSEIDNIQILQEISNSLYECLCLCKMSPHMGG